MLKKLMYLLKLFFLLVFFSLPIKINSQVKNKKDKEQINLQKPHIEISRKTDFDKVKYFFLKKNWDSTLVNTSKVLQTSKKRSSLDYCHYVRGYSFMKKKLFNEAKKEYNLVPKSFPNYYKVIKNLGGIAFELKEYKEAICYFETLMTSEINTSIKSYVLHDLGSCYFLLSKYNKAEIYLLQAHQIQEKQKDTVFLINSFTDIANLYYVQYKDNQAIPYFEKAYRLSKNFKNFELKKKTSKNMSVVEENRKNLTKALVYRKEFERWNDSLNDQNEIWSIAQVEKKYAVNKKQKQIKLLEVENKVKITQRNGFVISSILLLLLLSTSLYFYYRKNKTNKIILTQKNELNTLNATKDKLLSVISHDLRSSVNAFKQSSSKLLKDINDNNYEKLPKIARKNTAIASSTSSLLDNILHWATIQNHQLYFSRESVNLCSVMEQTAYNYKPLFEDKNIIFKNTIPKSVFVWADLDSLKITTRNLLDNAIKFSKETGIISVYLYKEEDGFYYFVIEDTGIGMSKETQEALLKEGVLLNKKKNQKGLGTGLGIQLCKSMIKRNKGRFLIESTEGIGTKMIIALPKLVQNG